MFYAYAYPELRRLRRPPSAPRRSTQHRGRQFLPYEAVRTASDPTGIDRIPAHHLRGRGRT
ncbi:MAG TPA: DUF5996 family protein [Pseudonocardiaceae bacterium]|nr:DUF5996 family protein [Pseudonocardiaceae bacterium]